MLGCSSVVFNVFCLTVRLSVHLSIYLSIHPSIQMTRIHTTNLYSFCKWTSQTTDKNELLLHCSDMRWLLGLIKYPINDYLELNSSDAAKAFDNTNDKNCVKFFSWKMLQIGSSLICQTMSSSSHSGIFFHLTFYHFYPLLK